MNKVWLLVMMSATILQLFGASPASAAQAAQDSRLQQMSPPGRQRLLDEAGQAISYCEQNPTLGGLYDCPCFSQKVLDARLNGDADPFSNLVFKLDYATCASESKAVKYFSDRAQPILLRGSKYTTEQKSKIADCVGTTGAKNYVARPIPSIKLIDGIFSSALLACQGQAQTAAPVTAPASTAQTTPERSGSQSAHVDVSGTWMIGPFAYTVTQDGDKVTSESAFGHGEGHFTGPNTFVMAWNIGTFIATVQGDVINWNNRTRWIRPRSGVASQTPAPAITPRAGQPQVPPTSSTGASVPGSRAASSTHPTEATQDARLQHMNPADRNRVSTEAAYCQRQFGLDQLFDCSCFAEKILDARSSGNTDPLSTLLSQLDYRTCASESKAVKYFTDRTHLAFARVLLTGPKYSSEQKTHIADCVGGTGAKTFMQKPVPSPGSVDELFNNVLAGCDPSRQVGTAVPMSPSVAQSPGPVSGNVDGTWTATIGKTTRQSRFILHQSGVKITGTLNDAPLEGTVENGLIKFTVDGITRYEGKLVAVGSDLRMLGTVPNIWNAWRPPGR